MIHRPTLLALSAALSGALLVLGPITPGVSSAASGEARPASLTFSPHVAYIGGQGMTLTGQLPKAGVRRIWLELHMNRPGDSWTRIEDRPYRGRTRADGSFTMKIHAPSMIDISYRVRGAHGGGVTPAVTFYPKTQDVEMHVVDPLDLDLVDPIAGLPFVVAADTTPTLHHRPDTQGVPIFVGRELTLQRRVSPTRWETIGESQVGRDGMGYFPPISESERGTYVYRVRMEDWTRNGSDIGWQASFPTYVEVSNLVDGRARPEAFRQARASGVPPSEREVVVTDTAAAEYGWHPVRWGFNWEEGQDLDSPPGKGTRKGHWVQYADGAGRVGKHNGGLRLDSGRLVAGGVGDFGTTRATLAGNADVYGRWETRLRLKTFETRSEDYDILLELVPERAQDYACGRRNITVARYTGAGSRMTFGVNAMDTRWTKTIRAPSLAGNIPAFAVEVARDHISWFVNGKPVGVVKGKAAVSDVPMTLRFSLVGDQDTEHKNTSVYSDWQRGFGIEAGRQVKKGPRLVKSALNGCVD